MTIRTLVLFELDGVLVEQKSSRRLPGTAETLAQLRHGGDTVLSLLTADDMDSARRRTTATGLDRYLDFAVGAYGSDPASLAKERARESYGADFAVVVVTTGRACPDADHTVRDLADVTEIVQQTKTTKES
jgi:ribonucleotide monophosphatase NagD (HAD superfamily)